MTPNQNWDEIAFTIVDDTDMDGNPILMVDVDGVIRVTEDELVTMLDAIRAEQGKRERENRRIYTPGTRFCVNGAWYITIRREDGFKLFPGVVNNETALFAVQRTTGRITWWSNPLAHTDDFIIGT